MRDQGLSGAGAGWAVVGLSRSAARAELPVWEAFTWQNGFRGDRGLRSACNWFMPGEFLRSGPFRMDARNWTIRLKGKDGPYAPRHLQLKFERVSVWVHFTGGSARGRRA